MRRSTSSLRSCCGSGCFGVDPPLPQIASNSAAAFCSSSLALAHSAIVNRFVAATLAELEDLEPPGLPPGAFFAGLYSRKSIETYYYIPKPEGVQPHTTLYKAVKR